MLNKTKSLHIPPQCTSYMYQSLIQPILLYGSDIWGINTAAQRSSDKVFYWFLKILLNVKRNTSNVMLVGEVGMFPPSSLCHRITLPLDSVVKSVFLESKRLCELGHRNWYTNVLELAQSYNLCKDSLDDSNATKHLIKPTVTAKYVSDWHAKLQDINNNPILSFEPVPTPWKSNGVGTLILLPR